MHEQFPVGAILTNGLGLDACRGLVITTQFHLLNCGIAVKVVKSGGGGSKPFAPGAVQNMYKPVGDGTYTPSAPIYTPVNMDNFASPKNIVEIKITIGDNVKERSYVLNNKINGPLVNTLRRINKAQSAVSVVINKISKVIGGGIINIRKVRKQK